jgi:hypothetical protein
MDAPLEIPPQLASEGRFQSLTRLGFAARGLLYIVVAFLVLRTGRTEDLTGALQYLGEGSGELLLVLVAVGLGVYGLWRLSDAAFGMEHSGTDWKALVKRAGVGLIGAIYLYLCYKAVRIAQGEGGGAANTRSQADTLLDLPGGHLMLAFAALVLAVAGAAQLRKAISCSFLRTLREGAGQQEWVRWMGRLGYAARGVIFLGVALLVGRAALDRRSDEVGGMEQVLDLLSGPLLYAVGAGLMLFGLFSLVEARYRRVERPPVGNL